MATILTKEEFYNKLKVMSKDRRGRKSDHDVSVTRSVLNDGSMSNYLNFTFRNGVHEFFSSGRVSFAVFKNRLIILDDKDGFAMTKMNRDDNGSRYIKAYITNGREGLVSFENDNYDLKWDDLYEYYYIEKE